MPRDLHDERTVHVKTTPVSFAQMQSWIKQDGHLIHTVLPPAFPGSQFQPKCHGSTGSVAERERQKRIANSKLDRLADELRALGIRF